LDFKYIRGVVINHISRKPVFFFFLFDSRHILYAHHVIAEKNKLCYVKLLFIFRRQTIGPFH